MNAEALIGTTLGTCTLQGLIGQGGMGAVYLAQQMRPRRYVAVKVLLPTTTFKSHQLAAFLERFRRETDAAAALEHPNIIPVYEYGEQDGLAYLVMPYIRGGTLRDAMEREGPLPLSKTLHYLEQLAAALDFAHERGMIHRDIKPANILLTREDRVLLTDFGLVKIIADGYPAQVRLTAPGAPVGTPDYMSPEQVIGDDIDGRADLYSLGVILYQMVTGMTPFQGETPMQISMQHLHMPPASPRLYRSDLPRSAEEVILRALAKRPGERYARGKDFSGAFSHALASSVGTPLIANQGEEKIYSQSRPLASQGLFDPTWQTGRAIDNLDSSKSTGTFPTASNRNTGTLSTFHAGMLAPTGGTENAVGLNQMSPRLNTTGSLAVPNSEQSSPSTIKLTGPVKVVQMPIAGKPGHFVTGLLPVVTPEVLPAATTSPLRPHMKIMAIALACMLVVLGTIGMFWLVVAPDSQTTSDSTTGAVKETPNLKATAAAKATATAIANTILIDPLSRNIHNWPSSPSNVYAFTGGAYHVTDRGTNGIAVVLQDTPFNIPIAYTLTMQEIQGDDTSMDNSFGMILRFNQQNKSGQSITTFYSFEVVNIPNGDYRFYKYDNSGGPNINPWTEVWHQVFGHEFHRGQGPHNINTFKVYANGSSFTFTVNGTVIGSVTDNSFKSGNIGMLVNLNGTEVAFSNLKITHH